MAVIDDGQTLKDTAKGHQNTASIVKGEGRRHSFAPGRIGSSLRLDGQKGEVCTSLSRLRTPDNRIYHHGVDLCQDPAKERYSRLRHESYGRRNISLWASGDLGI